MADDQGRDDQALVLERPGHLRLACMPSAEELRAHYQRYYAAPDAASSQYAVTYSSEEREHKALPAAEAEAVAGLPGGSLIEIGCGEGFCLDYFARRGWSVAGIEFTDVGVRRFFPGLASRIHVGDALELLARGGRSGLGSHDLVICNNVLEHVIDPGGLLKASRELLKPSGLLRVQVPNDGSWIQEELTRLGFAPPRAWLRPPEHLHYFTFDGLGAILADHGFELVEMLGDFPIELFCFNERSRYSQDRSLGKSCHAARVAFELGAWRSGIDVLLRHRRAWAAAGVGRNCIAYARAV